MSIHVFSSRAALLACAAYLGACAGAQHTQLLFTAQNDAGESFQCTKADSGVRSEHRQAKCSAIGSAPVEVGNADVHVDMPVCDSGVYRTITIMNADSDSPTVYVTCGQASQGHNLDGEAVPDAS